VPLTPDAVISFERCIGRGGVAIFPADTVYGLACNPGSESSVRRMHDLKKRGAGRPSAVMFFQLERALAALEELGERTREALRRLLPGPVTVVLPNPSRRYALAGGGDTLGLRVPNLKAMEGRLGPLAEARVAVLQTSANPSGGSDARRVSDLDTELVRGVDIVLDGGELSGTPSSVVDLTRFEQSQQWNMLRETALTRDQIGALLTTSREPSP
jgi:L-threonylcarbamoyladenylate synthase